MCFFAEINMLYAERERERERYTSQAQNSGMGLESIKRDIHVKNLKGFVRFRYRDVQEGVDASKRETELQRELKVDR